MKRLTYTLMSTEMRPLLKRNKECEFYVSHKKCEFYVVTGKIRSNNGGGALEGGEGVLEVRDVLDELNGATANKEVVVHHAANSDHSKAAVLELHKLAAGESVGVLATTEGVEAKVAGHALRALERLDDGRHARDGLEEADPQEQLLHGAL